MKLYLEMFMFKLCCCKHNKKRERLLDSNSINHMFGFDCMFKQLNYKT